MANTRLKITQLQDGTDGELITWDSSGNPTTVATGTSGHVLTSNGTGAAPTFQPISVTDTNIYDDDGTIADGRVAFLGGTFDLGAARFSTYQMQPTNGYVIGNSSSQLTLGGSSHTNKVVVQSSHAAPGAIDMIIGNTSGIARVYANNSATPNALTIGSGNKSAASTNFYNLTNSYGYTPSTSGSGSFTIYHGNGTINQTGTANQSYYAFRAAPTVVSILGNYYSFHTNINHANGYGFVQTGANSKNYLIGNTSFGTSSISHNLRVDGDIQFNLGADAEGDIYYRNSSGDLTRLPAGTDTHVLTLSSGVPTWAAPASGADGNGIYDDSGTIAPAAVATLTSASTFTIDYSSSRAALDIQDSGGSIELRADTAGTNSLTVGDNSIAYTTSGGALFQMAGANSYFSGPLSVGTSTVDHAFRADGAVEFNLSGTEDFQVLFSSGNYAFDADNNTGDIQMQTGSLGTALLLDNSGQFTVSLGGNPALVVDSSDITVGANGQTVTIGNNTTSRLEFVEQSGTNVTGFIAPSGITTDLMYTLPNGGTPTDGHVLTYNTGGTLSWEAAATGNDSIYTASGTIFGGAVATLTDDTTFTIDYFDGSNALIFNDVGETFNLTSGAGYGLSGNGTTVQMLGPSSQYINITSAGALVNADRLSILGGFRLAEDITPSQITADQNDYNPTGLSTSAIIRLHSDATRNITGIVPPSGDGDILFLRNIGVNNIILADDDANSAATNRFYFNGDVTLAPGETFAIIYDDVENIWYPLIGNATNTGSGGGVTGTGSDNQVAIWTATSGQIEGSSNLVFDGSRLGVGGTINTSYSITSLGALRNTGALHSIGTGAASGSLSSPSLRLENTTPTTGDIHYIGSTNTGELTIESGDASIMATFETDGTLTLTYGLTVEEINTQFEPSVNSSANGRVTSDFNASTTLAAGDLVYLTASSTWQKADSDTEGAATGFLAIALEAGTASNPIKVALPGSVVRLDSWSWGTVGGKLWIHSSTAGLMTQTPPTASGDYRRLLGWATSDDSIWFEPSNEWVTIT